LETKRLIAVFLAFTPERETFEALLSKAPSGKSFFFQPHSLKRNFFPPHYASGDETILNGSLPHLSKNHQLEKTKSFEPYQCA